MSFLRLGYKKMLASHFASRLFSHLLTLMIDN